MSVSPYPPIPTGGDCVGDILKFIMSPTPTCQCRRYLLYRQPSDMSVYNSRGVGIGRVGIGNVGIGGVIIGNKVLGVSYNDVVKGGTTLLFMELYLPSTLSCF